MSRQHDRPESDLIFPNSISARELAALPRQPLPRAWGPWKHDKRRRTLTHVPQDYELDLDEFTTSDAVLNMLVHVGKKSWCTPMDAGYLLQAFTALLKPQDLIFR